VFLDSNLADKKFCTEWQQAFPDFKLLLISSWIEFRFIRAVPKYLTFQSIYCPVLHCYVAPNHCLSTTRLGYRACHVPCI
jgi:hypothetical protein